MSADEFDNMPDDFADISGVDWARILAGPSTSANSTSAEDQISDLPGTGEGIPIPSIPTVTLPSSSSSSMDNFEDAYDDFDPSILAELDRIEEELARGKAIGFYILWTPYLLFIFSSRTTTIWVNFGLTAFSLLLRCVFIYY